MKPIKKNTKKEFIQLRVTAEEKREIKMQSEKSGFDTMSAYLLRLFRKYGKKD